MEQQIRMVSWRSEGARELVRALIQVAEQSQQDGEGLASVRDLSRPFHLIGYDTNIWVDGKARGDSSRVTQQAGNRVFEITAQTVCEGEVPDYRQRIDELLARAAGILLEQGQAGAPPTPEGA